MSESFLNAIRESIDNALRRRIVELWQRQNPGAVPQTGAPLTVTIDWRELGSVVDELARNASQAVVLLPGDVCALDAIKDAFEAGLMCGELGHIANYGNGDFAKGREEAAIEYVNSVAARVG